MFLEKTIMVINEAAFDDSPRNQWCEWFAWRPVKINSQTYWLTKVYRRRILIGSPRLRYEYGTLFDVLKTEYQTEEIKTPNYNVAVGYHASLSTTTGKYNVAIGDQHVT
jgi:hypothetical protein